MGYKNGGSGDTWVGKNATSSLLSSWKKSFLDASLSPFFLHRDLLDPCAKTDALLVGIPKRCNVEKWYTSKTRLVNDTGIFVEKAELSSGQANVVT